MRRLKSVRTINSRLTAASPAPRIKVPYISFFQFPESLTSKEADCHIGMGHRAVQEKRTIFRKRVLKTAQIVLSEKASRLDCAIRNLSDTGACLQVSTTYGIPTNFEVIIEGTRRNCRSIWRTDTKIGVMFA